MINLLPPEEQSRLQLANTERLAVVLGNVLVIALVCLLLVLLSLRFFVLGNDLYYKGVLGDIDRQYQRQNLSELATSVKKYNVDLTKANVFYKQQMYISDVLASVLDIARPEGIHFTSISLNKDTATNSVNIQLSGVSNTRNSLLTFKDAITAQKNISNVYFPPESWIKQTDVVFSMTMQIKHP